MDFTKAGINRNILECKYTLGQTKTFKDFCINRNILECKFKNNIIFIRTHMVLIETYWNVNITI